MTDNNVTRLHRRVITLKSGQQVEIPDDAEGRPIEEVFSHVIGSLKGALVYEIGGRRYIAVQDEPDNGR
ncbi:hypothetical protein [Jiella marina]|uniref:hypothetical protein n=1 Tax=Jiella sp. LLJ827 TaxID=2917712 RepID=UPI0021017CE2|nr:hypothetical protein [Jiella sp. LLJ827]MCQ0990595.1 hypothetical protein [Jiella sp. LLJ827]